MLRSTNQRPAKALISVAIMLPAMCGILGLVLDAGVFMTTKRQAQAAADAAARAAALERSLGGTDGDALIVAREYVQQLNNLPGAQVALNSPPLEGLYAGNAQYIEIVVTVPVDAHFIPVVGGPSRPVARARAVAGPELEAAKETIICLDPNAVPGFAVDKCDFTVKGRIWVNSHGAGSDESGGAVSLGLPASACRALNGGLLTVERLRVVGGVDTPSAYRAATGGLGFKARQLMRPDPLLNLPTPTISNGVQNVYPGPNGQAFAAPQHVSIAILAGQTVTFAPGIYGSIKITGTGGTVTFQPGIFVLKGGDAEGRALNINTSAVVNGTGIMFYNTGSNYDPSTGMPDQSDGDTLGTDTSATFGDVFISPSAANLTPNEVPGNTFAGMLIYQRRWNTRPLELFHNGGDDTIRGTVYAKWAKLTVHGPGTLHNQYVVGSFVATTPNSNGKMTIDPPSVRGRAKLIYLVE